MLNPMLRLIIQLIEYSCMKFYVLNIFCKTPARSSTGHLPQLLYVTYPSYAGCSQAVPVHRAFASSILYLHAGVPTYLSCKCLANTMEQSHICDLNGRGEPHACGQWPPEPSQPWGHMSPPGRTRHAADVLTDHSQLQSQCIKLQLQLQQACEVLREEPSHRRPNGELARADQLGQVGK